MKDGIDNLLFNCIGVSAGQSLAIISEQGKGGYYSATLDHAVAKRAREHAIDARIVVAPVLEEVEAFPKHIQEAIDATDHSLFLARMGDQVRFVELSKGSSLTVSYALDEESFSAPFCSADHTFFEKFLGLINTAVFGGRTIEIRCPSGTHLTGTSPEHRHDEAVDEVKIKRFPITVFRPVCCKKFSGRVALTRWLAPTGSRLYKPESVLLDSTVYALIENGRIVDFDGEKKDVDKVSCHYAYVADKYKIDGSILHSWHAGMHPQNGYDGLASNYLARWSGAAFGNPRYLHIHTCGDYAPGEISMSVFDPTISVDGVDFWRDGRLVFADTPEVRELQSHYPGMRELFENPVLEYGLGDS